ncbi:MAG TPA: polysaccharide deacetylase family protein [Phycisphaerae bacterium]|nr:polysaccharide deacetylase family protein [Phycisphaerae bacterium]HNU45436.1 polysaccharide deacetylase family protein [Phycisphaerae bacterium]
MDGYLFDEPAAPPPTEPAAEGPRCLVVMYHYVHDDSEPQPLRAEGVVGLSVREFEQQLDQLCTALEPVSWRSLYAWTQGEAALPQRSFLLTFDDGLADHARVVAPILHRRGLRGVFFVPGAVLTEGTLLSAHAIHLLLSLLGEQELQAHLLDYLNREVEQKDWLAEVDDEAARRLYHYEAISRAKLKYFLAMTLPAAVRRTAVEALFTEHIGSARRWAQEWYLQREDVCSLQAQGHTIGGHGHSHEPYFRLSAGAARGDAQHVAHVLNEIVGPDLRPFSYPYGGYSSDAAEAVATAGFVHAFTTERRWVEPGCRSFALPRTDTIYVEAELAAEPASCPVP